MQIQITVNFENDAFNEGMDELHTYLECYESTKGLRSGVLGSKQGVFYYETDLVVKKDELTSRVKNHFAEKNITSLSISEINIFKC